MDELTDLLVAGRDGDRLSLAAWIRRTQPEVWRLCAHLVDSSAADDLTQETYLRAWKALPSYRAEASARTWLLAIARRVCADAIRSRTRRRRTAATQPEAMADPTNVVSVAVLLDTLDVHQREAFVLTQLLGLSYQEAATTCGCAIGTIRSRVARARVALITQLEVTTDDSAEPPASA